MTPRRREGPTINRQTGYFFADFYVGIGKETHRYRKSLKTKDPKRAQWLWDQEYKKQWERYYGVGPAPFVGPVYFSDAVEDYVIYERDIKRIKDWRTVKHRLRIISEVWPDVTFDRLTASNFKALDSRLREMHRSEATINHYVKTIRALYAWAIKKKFVKENPAKEIPYYVTPLKRRAYSMEEIGRIMGAASKIEKEIDDNQGVMRQARRIIVMLLYTGMRTGEIINLKWQGVDGEAIRLDRTETKQRKEKIVPLTEPVQTVLEELRQARQDDFVFPFRRRQGKFRPVYMDSLILKIREYSGVKDFVFHGLRHTASTIMVSKALGRGAGLADIMAILGHSNLSTTLLYTHPDMVRMKAALETIVETQDLVKKKKVE